MSTQTSYNARDRHRHEETPRSFYSLSCTARHCGFIGKALAENDNLVCDVYGITAEERKIIEAQ